MNAIRFVAAAILVSLLLSQYGCEDQLAIVNDEDPSFVSSLFAIAESNAVILGWSGVHAPALAGFQLHRSTAAGFDASQSTVLALLPASATLYADTAVDRGVTYYYRLVPVEALPGNVRRPGISPGITPGRPYDYSRVSVPDYSEHIQPIFSSGCAVSGCHSEPTNLHPGDHQVIAKSLHAGPVSLAAWEDLFRGGEQGALVVPYRSTMSHLVYHLNTDTVTAPVSTPQMPPAGLTFPTEQLRVLMRWIDAGAPNDQGAVAFSEYPGGKILATNQAEDVVAVIDRRSHLVARYVTAGLERVVPPLTPQAPHNITVDRANGVYYVNLVNAGKVLKYNLADNRLLASLDGCLSPTQVALTSTGDTGFVAQFQQFVNTVRMFDTRTMQFLPDDIRHPRIDKPHGVQLTPDGRSLVVTGNLSDNVLFYDIGLHTTRLVWLHPDSTSPSTDLLPYQTVMTADNRYVYVSCQKSGEVRVIDRDSMRVTRVIPVGQWPLIMDITPDNRWVYVANRNSNDVSVIRTADNIVVATIAGVGPQPHGIAIDAAGRYAYVTCENVSGTGTPPHHPTSGSRLPGFVAVLDLGTNTVIRTIEVGNFAAGIAVIE